jgi:hypothetical protein
VVAALVPPLAQVGPQAILVGQPEAQAGAIKLELPLLTVLILFPVITEFLPYPLVGQAQV